MALQDSYAALVQQARELMSAGQNEQAFDTLRRVILRLSKLSAATLDKRPDLRSLFIAALIDAELLGRRLGRTEAVIELGEALGKGLPLFSDVGKVIQAQALSDAGHLDEAMALLLAASKADDAKPEGLRLMASEALWNHRPEDALEILAGALHTETPQQEQNSRRAIAELWYQRFRALAMLGRSEEAGEAWLKAYHLARQAPPPAREVVEMFVARGDLDKALEFADREAQPAARGLWRGVVAAMKGKMEWARDEWWRVAREAFDVEKPDFAEWIEAALRLGELDKVDTALEAGIEKHGPSSRLIILDAVFEARKGNLDIARRLLRAVARLDYMDRHRRERHIQESDRWLFEQALPEGEERSELMALLFAPLTPEILAAWEQLEAREAPAYADVEADDELADEEVAADLPEPIEAAEPAPEA